MSYIRADKFQQQEPVAVEHGFHLPEIDFDDRPTVDANLDDELLGAVLEIVRMIDELDEDEALVVWKEIF